MAEVDLSSYPKPTAPKSALEVASDFGKLKQQQQQIESGGLTIDKQKLDNANQAMGYMTRAMTALGPDATKDDYKRAGAQAVQLGLVPANALAVWNNKIDSAPTARAAFDEFITQAQHHKEIFDYHLGPAGFDDNGQTRTPIRTPGRTGAPVATGLPIQMQPSVGTPSVGPGGTPTALGAQSPQLPPNAASGRTGIPGQFALPVGPREGVAGPSTNFGPPGTQVLGASVEPPMTPRGPALKLPPGVGEAQTAVSQASGGALAGELDAARNYQREVFPLQQAIPALEKLGTKGTGPGTETFNHIKSFILSNVPGVKESDFKGTVADYDKAQKYLIDFVNANGNTGTNDKLAASFAGNPSVKISNAAAVDVAKSALALRHMRQAQIMEFQKAGLTPDKFTTWAANWTEKHDPRAFGVNLMSDEAKKKLFEELHKKGREKELENFENSLSTAAKFGLIK